jgi:DNA mismatch repair protein MutS2
VAGAEVRVAVPSNSVNGNSFRTLEFEAIRTLLLGHAGSAQGRRRVVSLAPGTDAEAVRSALALTSEGLTLLEKVGRQPYHDLPEVDETLARARVEGYLLEPLQLLDVASFAEGAGEIARAVARAEGAPRLSRLASEVRDASPLAAAIRRAILPSGEVADDASPALAEIRRRIARLRTRLHSVMESYLHGKDADRVLQEKLVTTRNDRYVLLVKAELRGHFQGVVHGSSGSGASLFVEPMPAVELNNDIVALGEDERQEIVRILRELSRRVFEVVGDLLGASESIGELDAVQARALLAREMDASAPEVVAKQELELLDARHPLLEPRFCERLGLPRRSSRAPVPVTLRLSAETPVLVISGPNTGGKTVALKTVGLLALMAQSGLHVPAAPGSRLPVFRRVFADIGDEQSITADLSTFSAHLATIVEMTRDLERPALVLLDEVGAGTDPTEGGGLGVAIVDHFRRAGAMVVATTHHGLMKAYAQATDGVACASFGYDPRTFEPSYRLQLGVPGRSLALEMAERLGLPEPIVADARARLDDKAVQADALLKRLEGERLELDRERARLARERQELGRQQAGLSRAEAEIAARKRDAAESFARELRRKGEEAAQKAALAIESAVERVSRSRQPSATAAARARTAATTAIRRVERELLKDPELGLEPEVDVNAAAIEVGGRVRVRDLGLLGEVMSQHGEMVEVAVSGKRMRVPRTALLPVAARPASRYVPSCPPPPPPREAPGEINLVGLTVDEALPRVDKLLDDAALSERHEIRVIHGFGAGRLRRAVAELLEDHPHVAAFRLGKPNEGGGGVTVVELKG